MKNKSQLPNKKQDDLLWLIEKGNAERILAKKSFEDLNTVMRYELISLDNGKLSLTEREKEAKKHGVQEVIYRLHEKARIAETTAGKSNKNGKNYFSLLMRFVSLLRFNNKQRK